MVTVEVEEVDKSRMYIEYYNLKRIKKKKKT